LQIKVEFYDGKAVGIELPQTVELTVLETEPGLKSATASSVTKPAKTETGLVVQVPPFINEGEKIKVDTAEGSLLVAGVRAVIGAVHARSPSTGSGQALGPLERTRALRDDLRFGWLTCFSRYGKF
jgi:hypothetical protein